MRTVAARACAERLSPLAIVSMVGPSVAMPSADIVWNVIFLTKLSRFTPLKAVAQAAVGRVWFVPVA